MAFGPVVPSLSGTWRGNKSLDAEKVGRKGMAARSVFHKDRLRARTYPLWTELDIKRLCT